jgi:hypothetical protein
MISTSDLFATAPLSVPLPPPNAHILPLPAPPPAYSRGSGSPLNTDFARFLTRQQFKTLRGWFRSRTHWRIEVYDLDLDGIPVEVAQIRLPGQFDDGGDLTESWTIMPLPGGAVWVLFGDDQTATYSTLSAALRDIGRLRVDKLGPPAASRKAAARRAVEQNEASGTNGSAEPH